MTAAASSGARRCTRTKRRCPFALTFQASENHSIVGRYMLTTDDRQIPFDAAGGNILVTNAGAPTTARTTLPSVIPG